MATLSIEGLQALFKSIDPNEDLQQSALADVQNSPMDIYLSYLANKLVTLTGCDPQHAYDAIQWPNDMGDLVVVIPRLRLKDIAPVDLALDLQASVCSPLCQNDTSILIQYF